MRERGREREGGCLKRLKEMHSEACYRCYLATPLVLLSSSLCTCAFTVARQVFLSYPSPTCSFCEIFVERTNVSYSILNLCLCLTALIFLGSPALLEQRLRYAAVRHSQTRVPGPRAGGASGLERLHRHGNLPATSAGRTRQHVFGGAVRFHCLL